MQLETVIVRLHDCVGTERGYVELPAAWALAPGDVLCDNEGQAVRVLSLVALSLVALFPPTPVAALVKVTPVPALRP